MELEEALELAPQPAVVDHLAHAFGVQQRRLRGAPREVHERVRDAHVLERAVAALPGHLGVRLDGELHPHLGGVLARAERGHAAVRVGVLALARVLAFTGIGGGTVRHAGVDGHLDPLALVVQAAREAARDAPLVRVHRVGEQVAQERVRVAGHRRKRPKERGGQVVPAGREQRGPVGRHEHGVRLRAAPLDRGALAAVVAVDGGVSRGELGVFVL